MRALALLLVICSSLAHAATELPPARNLQAEAEGRAPLVLLVSMTDCRFCEQVRRSHLLPLAKSGVTVREIHLDLDDTLIGFDGRPTTQRRLAKSLAVRVAPTVFFFDAGGRQASAPIVGALLDDFYGAYLERALEAARAAARGALYNATSVFPPATGSTR